MDERPPEDEKTRKDAPLSSGDDADRKEIEALAGFGAVPTGPLGAPLYALRVFRRQKELKAALAKLNDEKLIKAERRRDAAEAELGQLALDAGLFKQEAEELAAKLAKQVQEAERTVAKAEGRTSKEDEAYATGVHQLNEEEESLQSILQTLLGRETKLVEELREAEAEEQRRLARAHRVQIERRALDQAVAAGGMPADQVAARRAQLDSAAARIAAEAQGAQAGRVASLRQEQVRTRAQIGPVRAKLEGLDDEREALLNAHEERLGLHTKDARLATNWRRSRLAAIGRKVLERQPPANLKGSARLVVRIEEARRKVAAVHADVDRHVRALDAYDRPTLARGKFVALGAGALLVVILVVVVLVALH